MQRIKIVVLSRPLDVATVAKFTALLTLALIIPLIGLDQRITGPLVNALLIISAVTVGLPGAVMVGVLPSLASLARGTLPLPMAAMVPYIILGNAALVVVFALLRSRGYWPAVVVGSLVKFGLLSAAVTYLVTVPAPLAVMMHWPQLYTALLGGLLAWWIIKLSRQHIGNR